MIVLLSVVCVLGTVLQDDVCVPVTCPQGEWSGSECVACSPGTYRHEDYGCVPCAPQHVSPGFGATACERCPDHLHPNQQLTACVAFEDAGCAWPGLPPDCYEPQLACGDHNETYRCEGGACETSSECVDQWQHEGCEPECATLHDLLAPYVRLRRAWVLGSGLFLSLYVIITGIIMCVSPTSDWD